MAFTDAERMAAAQLAIDRYHKLNIVPAVRPDKIDYYVPPKDWLDLGMPINGEIRLLLSDAAGGEYCFYFESYSPDDTITITWGDGTSNSYTGGTSYYANHAYTVGSGTACSYGYTQFKCILYVNQSSTLYDFRIVGPNSGAVQQKCGALGIKMNINIYRWATPYATCAMLEYFYSYCEYIWLSSTDVDAIFSGTALQKLYLKRLAVSWNDAPVNIRDILALPPTLIELIIEQAYALLQSAVGAFKNYYALKKVILGQSQDLYDATEMFCGCSSLEFVGLYLAQSLDNVENTFKDCASILNFRQITDSTIDMINDSTVELVAGINIQGNLVSTLNIDKMLLGCTRLETLEFGTNLSADTPVVLSAFPNLRKVTFVSEYSLYSTSPTFEMKNNPKLLYADLQNFPALTSVSSLFENNPVLKTLIFGTAVSGSLTDMSYLFRNDENFVDFQNLNEYSFVYCSNATGILYNCQRFIDFINYSFGAAQQGSLGTDMSEAFIKAYNINNITLPSCAMTRIDVGCDPNRLTKLSTLTFSLAPPVFTGAAPQINISYCDITAAELNALFTSLPTIAGKTIDITGCSGAATCDQSIATSKGWTVVN